MSNYRSSKVGIAGKRSGLGMIPAVAVSLALTMGCAALDELESEGDPSRARESVSTLDPHVEQYLAPFVNARDGAKRKVGSDWYVRTDGRWTERED